MVGANQGGEVGYILPRKAFANEGYEAWPSRSARVGPGAGEFLAQLAMDLLRELCPTDLAEPARHAAAKWES